MTQPIYRSKQFHKHYLKVSSFIIGSFGPIFFLGSMIQFSEPARLSLDLLAWPIDGTQSYSEPTTRFLSALTGGFLFGWGITIWFLQKWVFNKAPNQVRKSVLIGLCSWFVLDSLGSTLSGNSSNVLFNVMVLLLAAGPLWFSLPEEN